MAEATTLTTPVTTRLRVLLAEDDLPTQRILARLIEKEGFQVVAVDNGRAALNQLRENANFAAVVLDHYMPDTTGLDVLAMMQAEDRLRRIPTMMVSNVEDLSLVGQSFARGNIFFINKPVAPEQFQKLLHALIDFGKRQAAQAKSDINNVRSAP